MRRWGALLVLLAGLAGLLALDGSAGRAADDFKPEEGFVSLFNGKDLSGWRYGKEDLSGKTETADKRFTVENGIIVLTASTIVGRFLETFAEYPPRQRAASFTIDQAMEKLEATLTSGH